MVNEKWQPIPNFNGLYEISNKGRIKSLSRGCILKGGKSSKGYYGVQLFKKKKAYSFLVHRLVAFTFLPPSLFGSYVHHKDGNKGNNSVANLEWVTASDNNKAAYKMGLKPPIDVSGEKNGRAKLTWPQVAEIRLLAKTKSQRELARLYGVARTTIQWIIQGKHWRMAGKAAQCKAAGLAERR